MKKLLTVLCIFTACARAETERVAPGSHISLTAELTGNAAKGKDSYRDGAGGYDTKFIRSRSVVIHVRNFGRDPAEVELAMHWIGKPLDFRGSSPGISGHTSGINDRLLLSSSAKAYTLAPGATRTATSTTGDIEGTDLSLNLIGVRRVEGHRIEGWIAMVRAKDSGALLALTASDTHLAEFAQQGGLTALLPPKKKAAAVAVAAVPARPRMVAAAGSLLAGLEVMMARDTTRPVPEGNIPLIGLTVLAVWSQGCIGSTVGEDLALVKLNAKSKMPRIGEKVTFRAFPTGATFDQMWNGANFDVPVYQQP